MPRPTADATVFYAIADPTRRAILEALADGMAHPALSLLEVARATQSALSQHLAVLRRAGLVRVTKAGRQRLYALNPEPLCEVADWVRVFDAFWEDRLGRLGAHLDASHDAPSPPRGERGDTSP